MKKDSGRRDPRLRRERSAERAAHGGSGATRVDVALPLPIDRTFTYEVRGPAPAPAPGTRVLVPFRRKERIGWVVGPGEEGPIKGLRPVLTVLDDEPTVPDDLLSLCRWMAAYYVAPLGITLRAALPSVLSDVSRDYVTLREAGAGPGEDASASIEEGATAGAAPYLAGSPAEQAPRVDWSDLRPRERRVVDWLRGREGPQRVRTLRRALDMGSVWPEVRSLAGRGLLAHETVPPAPPPVKTRRVVRIARHLDALAERDEVLGRSEAPGRGGVPDRGDAPGRSGVPGRSEETGRSGVPGRSAVPGRNQVPGRNVDAGSVDRDEVFGRAARQREAYELLEASGGSTELATLTGDEGFSRSVITGLEDKGLVEVADEEELRDPFEDAAPDTPPDLTPTPRQQAALDALVAALDEERPLPHLLQGITGSGKTLVYIELLREVLRRGRSAIVLVPEISLTPQTVSRFRAHFGDQVAVLHSGLSDGERYDAWRMLRSGERSIAVGARSALFAPLRRLGAVVVDEEHEGSYKQSEAPRYHARDLAVVRARAHGAVCVLGSATPSMESWENARSGKFRRLELPERVGGGRLPRVHVVDLRAARKKESGDGRRGGETGPSDRGRGILSEPLMSAVDLRLRRQEQVILLLNRRGYASFVQCRECGEVEQCRNCSISLTYHRVTQRIVCHHCRFEAPAPERCPRCGSRDLSFRGLGTEQVERVAAETFPGARIARMDVDTTSGKWAHQRILERVERHEIDILLGTQMIAKGLDFPRVTLVGVVNADVGIHLPDFRASERTFQLLSQVAGRAGRSALGGEVFIQTSLPEHYAVRAAVDHDFEAFAEREAEERIKPRYPPWVRMANVVVSSPEQKLAAEAAERATRWLRVLLRRWRVDVDLVGPAPAPIERLHGRWRWHFFLRTESPRALGDVIAAFADGYRPPAGDVRLAIDRDPVALL